MECGVCGQPYKTPHTYPRRRHPPNPEWPSQEQRGSGLTASAPVSDVSAPACTKGICLLCGLWVWRRKTNRLPCCSPMSNPSTSSWTARSGGSGRWESNGCSTSAPRSSAAKQWIWRTGSKEARYEVPTFGTLGTFLFFNLHLRGSSFRIFPTCLEPPGVKYWRFGLSKTSWKCFDVSFTYRWLKLFS